MKKVLLTLVFLIAISNMLPAQKVKSVITVLPAMKELTNAETENNAIPWNRVNAEYDILLRARLMSEVTLVNTVKGNYTYTLHKFVFMPEKIIQGEYGRSSLMFFIERKFPVKGTKTKFTEIWPFLTEKSLTFKLRKDGERRYKIVSIEP